MIIWSGRGILIPVFTVLGFIAGSLVGGVLGALAGEAAIERWGATLGLCGAAAALWLFARTFGKTKVQVLMDPATGQPVRLTKRHSLFFLPPTFWAVAVSMLALLVAVIPSRSSDRPKGEAHTGKAAFDDANDLLLSARKGAYHGNTAEAKQCAEAFSTTLNTVRKEGIEKGKRSSISLTKGEFLTYCLIKEDVCVFMVHVPELRKFAEDAKVFIAEAGWAVALKVLDEAGYKPSVVAVGIRGSLLYDRVIVGKSGPPDQYESLIQRTVDGNSESQAELERQFAAALKSSAATPTPAKVLTNAEAVEAVTEKPDPAPMVAATLPESPEGDEKPAMSAGAGNATPPTDAAPPAANSSPAASPEMAAPTAAPVEALHGIRTWTDTTGRTMQASFVRFTSDAADTAEFTRADGNSFVVPLARFSAADQAFITTHPELKK